ncbi:fibrillin-2 [Biomphalaria pfeifferi]|uniref:Fibrillin-2 n=1 Tax=Biomphalaria pfeifferi TaxID=112525 RepID=A0AAD8AY43_BIOPF|nr:fibrillin-2 [Biomphalaria pfeifferi]
MTKKLKEKNVDVLQFIVLQLSKGSLICDYTVSVNTSSSSDPKTSLSNAMKVIFSEGVVLNGTAVMIMRIVEDGTTVQPSTCDVKQRIDPCKDKYKCVVQNNEAVCKQSISGAEKLQMKYLLAVSLSVIVIFIFQQL